MNGHSVGLANFLADMYRTTKNMTSPILMVAESKIPISPQKYRVRGLASWAGLVTKMSRTLSKSKERNHDGKDGDFLSTWPFSPRSNAACANVLMLLDIYSFGTIFQNNYVRARNSILRT